MIFSSFTYKQLQSRLKERVNEKAKANVTIKVATFHQPWLLGRLPNQHAFAVSPHIEIKPVVEVRRQFCCDNLPRRDKVL